MRGLSFAWRHRVVMIAVLFQSSLTYAFSVQRDVCHFAISHDWATGSSIDLCVAECRAHHVSANCRQLCESLFMFSQSSVFSQAAASLALPPSVVLFKDSHGHVNERAPDEAAVRSLADLLERERLEAENIRRQETTVMNRLVRELQQNARREGRLDAERARLDRDRNALANERRQFEELRAKYQGEFLACRASSPVRPTPTLATPSGHASEHGANSGSTVQSAGGRGDGAAKKRTLSSGEEQVELNMVSLAERERELARPKGDVQEMQSSTIVSREKGNHFSETGDWKPISPVDDQGDAVISSSTSGCLYTLWSSGSSTVLVAAVVAELIQPALERLATHLALTGKFDLAMSVSKPVQYTPVANAIVPMVVCANGIFMDYPFAWRGVTHPLRFALCWALGWACAQLFHFLVLEDVPMTKLKDYVNFARKVGGAGVFLGGVLLCPCCDIIIVVELTATKLFPRFLDYTLRKIFELGGKELMFSDSRILLGNGLKMLLLLCIFPQDIHTTFMRALVVIEALHVLFEIWKLGGAIRRWVGLKSG